MDYFAVQWHQDVSALGDSIAISLAVHGGGDVENKSNGCLVSVIATDEYAELLHTGEQAGLSLLFLHTIQSREDFKDTLINMGQSSELFMTDMNWLWAFHGWSR